MSHTMHLIPSYTNHSSVFAPGFYLITMSGSLSIDILLQRFEQVEYPKCKVQTIWWVAMLLLANYSKNFV